ncbi:hypothetical protein ACFLQ2_03840 [archaeon]
MVHHFDIGGGEAPVQVEVPIPPEVGITVHRFELDSIADAHKRLAKHLEDFPNVRVVQYNILKNFGERPVKVSVFHEGHTLQDILDSKVSFPAKHLENALDLLEQVHNHLEETDMFLGDPNFSNILLSVENGKTMVTFLDQPFFEKAKGAHVSQVTEAEQFKEGDYDLYYGTLLPAISSLYDYLQQVKRS